MKKTIMSFAVATALIAPTAFADAPIASVDDALKAGNDYGI